VRGVLVSVLCFLLPLQPASAEEVAMADQPDVIETPEVVVSATKTPIPVKEVTSAVEVITGEQMQQRKVRTVAEALRLAQGTCRVPKWRAGHARRRADAGRDA
jgi:vitamin B12 transporter